MQDLIRRGIDQKPTEAADLAAQRAHGIADAATKREFCQGRYRRRSREPDDDRKRDAARIEIAQEFENRRGLETKLGDDVDANIVRLAPVAPVCERSEACLFVEKGMAFGVACDADAANAV